MNNYNLSLGLFLLASVILLGAFFVLLFWEVIKKIRENPSKAITDLVGIIGYIIFMGLIVTLLQSGFIIPIIIGIISIIMLAVVFVLILRFLPWLLYLIVGALIVALFIKLVLFFLSIL